MADTTSPQLLRLMSNARVRLPGVTDDALRLEIFNVFEEFLRESCIWEEDIGFKVNTEDDTYPIASSAGQILQLVSIVNSTKIPVSGVMLDPGTIWLATVPGQEETFTATVNLTVVDPIARDGYPELPDWILVKYLPGLTAGLIGKMMSQPAKPYSSGSAMTYLREFGDATNQASVDVIHGHTQGAQRWRYPRFA